MSGGRWGYREYRYQESAEELKNLFLFLGATEHEVDWAVCSDTCRDCTKNRLFEAIQLQFDGNTSAAIAVLRDSRQNQCESCAARGL